jgi:cell division protein ZapA
MPSAETVQVTIFNQTYSLRSTSGAEHVREIASQVDERMKEMASHITTHDISRIAILVALNIADEMQNLKAQYESEIERLLSGASAQAPDDNESSQRDAQPLERARGSWFEEIFDSEMPADSAERPERLSSQVSAKLQSLRKTETREPGKDKTED